jgi:hypothetical protein
VEQKIKTQKRVKKKTKKKKLDDKLELGQRWVEMLTMSRYGV